MSQCSLTYKPAKGGHRIALVIHQHLPSPPCSIGSSSPFTASSRTNRVGWPDVTHSARCCPPDRKEDKHEEEKVNEWIAAAVESNDRRPYLDDGCQCHVD
jgi:hypothetical protein